MSEPGYSVEMMDFDFFHRALGSSITTQQQVMTRLLHPTKKPPEIAALFACFVFAEQRNVLRFKAGY